MVVLSPTRSYPFRPTISTLVCVRGLKATKTWEWLPSCCIQCIKIKIISLYIPQYLHCHLSWVYAARKNLQLPPSHPNGSTTSGVMARAVQLAPRPRGAQWLLGSKALADITCSKTVWKIWKSYVCFTSRFMVISTYIKLISVYHLMILGPIQLVGLDI